MSKRIYKEYDESTLKRLQALEHTILLDFDRICQKYDIHYFLIAGSAIGCAREQGMIPWDDDIDIGMLREDYEKFLRIYPGEFKDRYSLYSPDVENKYYNLVPIMSKNGTKLVVEIANGLFEPGIFMDLFIFENIPDDLELAQKHIRKCLFWRNLYVASRSNLENIKDENFIQFVKYSVSRILRFVFSHIDKNGDWIYSHYIKLAKKYYNQTCTYTILGDPYASKNILYRDEIFPCRRMKFDDMEVNMLHGYDSYLTRRFGDYMTPPSKGQRENHSPVVLEFEED